MGSLGDLRMIRYATAGMSSKVTTIEASRAKDLVYASGLNSFPSAASRKKTGMKLRIVVPTAVSTAEPTSAAAL